MKVFYKNNSGFIRGPGSVLGIATGYGLDGPGIESRWGTAVAQWLRCCVKNRKVDGSIPACVS